MASSKDAITVMVKIKTDVEEKDALACLRVVEWYMNDTGKDIVIESGESGVRLSFCGKG